jgi:5-hydroxyisourate hydrolase
MLSTHVLDVMRGKPAAGLEVRLYHIMPDSREEIARAQTDADGRIAAPFGGTLEPGCYELLFYAGEYFRAHGNDAFYAEIPVQFLIASNDVKYHVPLLLSAFGYSTYRGS